MNSSIANLDEQFAVLDQRSCELTKRLTAETLYLKAPGSEHSSGEQLLRSAAVVERAFGVLTANLWDDPFEWTLPETLDSPEKVLEYLAEVETTRKHAFGSFKGDQDLSKEIMTPCGTTQVLSLLLDTLQQARHHQQCAIAAFDLLQRGN